MAEAFSQGLRIWVRGTDCPLGQGERHGESDGTYGSNSHRDQPGGSIWGVWKPERQSCPPSLGPRQ